MDRGLQQHPPLVKTSLAAHPWQQPVAEEETTAAFGSTRTRLPPHLAAVVVAVAPERRHRGQAAATCANGVSLQQGVSAVGKRPAPALPWTIMLMTNWRMRWSSSRAPAVTW